MLEWKERRLRIWRQRVGDIALSVVRDMAKFGRSGWVGHHSVRYSIIFFMRHSFVHHSVSSIKSSSCFRTSNLFLK